MKNKITVIIIAILLLISFFAWYFLVKKKGVSIDMSSIKNNQQVEDRKIAQKDYPLIISTTTPLGAKVVISFYRCDDVDFATCFGTGASDPVEIGEQTVYDLVSTSEKINFGVTSRANNKWPYIISVDFGDEIYTMEDYSYFKKSVPSFWSDTGSQ